MKNSSMKNEFIKEGEYYSGCVIECCLNFVRAKRVRAKRVRAKRVSIRCILCVYSANGHLTQQLHQLMASL
ncbi:hypothetical protein EB796_006618 [Bugula neritina]|uniref:Uncharacterized protein n=1 Tax=Bugula neritina TaxID=10212 RepID=A0A7J7K8W9_BUGNE|nr:hypothetical protein EB796_006618 [Bugula neritina]